MTSSHRFRWITVPLLAGALCATFGGFGGLRTSANAASLCYDARLATLVDSLSDLEAEVEAGISLTSHNALYVSALRAYKKVRWNSVSDVCFNKVGVPAEKALNAYAKAGNAWKTCLRDYDFTVDCTEPPYDNAVQAKWTVASRQLVIARRYGG